MPDMTNGTAQHKEEINIVAELKTDLAEEAHDNEKYKKLAEVADEKYPHKGYGAILRDIAREEKTHHKHIQMILEDMQASMEG